MYCFNLIIYPFFDFLLQNYSLLVTTTLNTCYNCVTCVTSGFLYVLLYGKSLLFSFSKRINFRLLLCFWNIITNFVPNFYWCTQTDEYKQQDSCSYRHRGCSFRCRISERPDPSTSWRKPFTFGHGARRNYPIVTFYPFSWLLWQVVGQHEHHTLSYRCKRWTPL